MATDFIKTAAMFKALSDPKRLAILELLKGGEQCACVLLDLLEQLELTQSGLSYHMKILVTSGIVTARQDGKWTYYSISDEGRQKAVDTLLTVTNAKKESHPCG